MTEGTAVVAGGVVRSARFAGHAWVFAQYVRGLRRLGWRTLFVDRVHHEELAAQPSAPLAAVLELLGGPDDVAVLDETGESVFGVSRADVKRRIASADFVLNVMGYLDDEELLAGSARRAFLDIDPGFGQMWRELGLADIFSGHDVYLTVAARVGEPATGVPTCGLRWVPTLPPVVLDDWPVRRARQDAPLTSLASWRGPFGPVAYQGRTYGLRVHEFRRFLDLPRLTPERFEVALDIDPADARDTEALREHGWVLVPPGEVAGTPEGYQRFIEESKAEIMVAKHMYVATGAGWFSDRSACYLASGRPVVAQDTGWRRRLPAGEGLLAFHDVESAVEALEDLDARYAEHCAAARSMAEAHFDSDVVLTRLLDEVLR